MLKEAFIGRNPSHFHISPIVKAFIISESLLWSAWNLITPITAIFVTTYIPNSNIETAASGFSVYLITRVIFELISGRYLMDSNEKKKILVTIVGMLFLTISHVGLAFTTSIFMFYLFFAAAGIGLGVASPAKNTLFSMNLDKNKAATEVGTTDAITFICMALATSLGGFVAQSYGFYVLFILAGVVNTLGIVPYLLYLGYKPSTS